VESGLTREIPRLDSISRSDASQYGEVEAAFQLSRISVHRISPDIFGAKIMRL
jgi:hypothetical protein